ncbi:MAG: hypothetical protein MUE81_14830 [Thermoflexibacter sp.]|jgi:hypothetical protein|nr:hypothetical protein [Thermoflexibacter sp.]
MWLYNFFNKRKTSDILTPKICPTEIPIEIISVIDKIDWKDFETAYGNAEKTIPYYLKNLFCADFKIAYEATHQLWCSLCHQHVILSNASLPAYDILKIALFKLDDDLKIELLDIFKGFAYCSIYLDSKDVQKEWVFQVRQKLLDDFEVFKNLIHHSEKQIAEFSKDICDCLETGNRKW